jgi:sugar (pentulose or hexulose) kinase
MTDAERIVAAQFVTDGASAATKESASRLAREVVNALIKNQTPAMIEAGVERYESVRTGGGVTRHDAIAASFAEMLCAETREEP